jgi:hypothetical protein
MGCCFSAAREDEAPLLGGRKGRPSPLKGKKKSSGKKWTPTAAPKCALCNKSVYPSERIGDIAGGREFHRACFRCSECNRALEGQQGWTVGSTLPPSFSGDEQEGGGLSLACKGCAEMRKRSGSVRQSTPKNQRHIVTHQGDVAGVKRTIGEKVGEGEEIEMEMA